MPRDVDRLGGSSVRIDAPVDAVTSADPAPPPAEAPSTTRIQGLLPRAPVTSFAPLSPAALRDGDAAARLLNDKLAYDVFDWAVTQRELRASIEALRGLDAGALARVVDQVEPKLLSRLTEKLPATMQSAYADTLARLNAARNAPSREAQDVDEAITALKKALDGLLTLDVVSAGEARVAIDRLRRLAPEDRERALDVLGPGKAYRMIDNLSAADRATYAPTVALVKGAFFGRLLRDSAAIGLGPKDVTAQLEALLADVAAGRAARPADLNDYVYFAVPGLVTEHQPGYMDGNVEHLRSMGVEVRRSAIDTDADVDVNAEQLRLEIQSLAAETGKKVVVIAHSKGGPDAAEALQDEATEACVHRFIPMQPASATPVANTLMDSALGDVIRDAFTEVLGASTGDALAQLAFSAAKDRFLRGRPLKVKTLALASTVGDHFSLLRGVSDLIETRYDVKSDGLVTIDEQFVPGEQSHRAVLDGLDHTAPCSMPLPGAPALKHPQGVLTEALVILALRL